MGTVPLNIHEHPPATRIHLESPNQNRRHLLTSDRFSRTKPSSTHSTLQTHTQNPKTLHIPRPPLRSIHIPITRKLHTQRYTLLKNPQQPNRHNPTLNRIIGAELPLGAFRSRKNTLDRQPFNRRTMHIRPINIKKPLLRQHPLPLSPRELLRNAHTTHPNHPQNQSNDDQHAQETY